MAQGDFNAALTDIDAVIAERPDLEPAYLARGDAHRELQQFDAALADYDHAIQLQPDDLIGYVRRANIFMGQTQPDLALIEYNRALDINSNAAIIYLMRSEAYKQTAQEAEAAADYLSWIRLIGTNNAVQDALQAGESRVLQMKEGQVFTLPFEGTAGQTITVTAQAQPDVQLDPLFLIMDADGNPLVGDDDSGANLDAQVTVTLPADGVYAVVLSHGGGGSDGPVSVKLTVG
jgi:tetratricopeptide (TPR) repeat protein